MSNRTIAQTDSRAALKVAHAAQIEALTMPGLSREERIERFGRAAGFTPEDILRAKSQFGSAAHAVWHNGRCQLSLFGNLPGCYCPVSEKHRGRAHWPDIPDCIPRDWQPTRTDLLAFSRVQQEARG